MMLAAHRRATKTLNIHGYVLGDFQRDAVDRLASLHFLNAWHDLTRRFTCLLLPAAKKAAT
jgi:hypothetical protein